MKRRVFLKSGAAAAAGFAFARAGLARVSAEKQKIIVIGAGLSGLVAAYELSKLGHEVRVLEAQARPGGRVLTVREFAEGLYAEAGAARIPSHHDLTLKYAKNFGLEFLPFYPTENKFMRFDHGRPEKVGWDKFSDATSFVMNLGKPSDWKKIKGGNDNLPAAFAKSLAGKIRYETPVVRIANVADRIEVTFKENGRLVTEECQRLLVAIPFSMLARLETVPAFSAAKVEAINSLRYESASRVFVETRRRFWADSKLNGFGFGDDFAEIWDATFGQPGTHGILQRYLRGGFSQGLMGQTEAQRAETSLAKLSSFFPEIRDNFVKSWSRCWNEDPWVLGAWGQVDGKRQAAARAPEGRVHFAGEHLSDHGSWMQGALESGLRAVSEMTAPAAVAASRSL